MDCITDPEIIQAYLKDASNIEGFADTLVRPKTTEEVAEIMRHCQANSIPITVTAQRTSTTGGPVPQGGWLLSTEKLDQIYSNTHVQGGVILGEYQRQTEAQGLLFPPDPTSRNECSVGAAIACNASGARCFRYGAIRPWVEWVRCVLPNGDIIEADRRTPIPDDWPRAQWIEPTVKTAAGYSPADNLLDLMIGQEGTLGIITEAKLKLIPNPSGVLGMIIFFEAVSDCLDCVDELRQGAQRPHQDALSSALNPRAIEYFDRFSLAFIRQKVDDIPDSAVCGLFVEVEYEEEPDLDSWLEVLESHNALCDDIIAAEDDESRARLYSIRHAIPAGVNETVIANGMPKVGTDFSVPDTAMREMMREYQDISMPHVLFGHMGDNHLHLNFLPRTADELIEAKRLYRVLALKAVSLGGTVSAEHGIGRIKTALLADMVGGVVLARFRQLKQALDPNWILGRGILLQTDQLV